MASSQFFALFDDIATLLDDVAAMTKVATKKTAGVLGDDLALNAQQVTGVSAQRELPVVWAVAKGSFLNKVILVPVALILSVALPAAIPILLVIGGLFLCFEGAEKILHAWDSKISNRSESIQAANTKNSNLDVENKADLKLHSYTQAVCAIKTEEELLTFEKEKIKGAIRTDFILSAEIVVISLGVVAEKALLQKSLVLSSIAIGMTIGVYGLVALIVKLDDFGFYLERSKSIITKGLGRALILLAPKLMKTLSWVGLVAMFLVGGGILVHNVPTLHHFVESAQSYKLVIENGVNFATGLSAGLMVAFLIESSKKLFNKS